MKSRAAEQDSLRRRSTGPGGRKYMLENTRGTYTAGIATRESVRRPESSQAMTRKIQGCAPGSSSFFHDDGFTLLASSAVRQAQGRRQRCRVPGRQNELQQQPCHGSPRQGADHCEEGEFRRATVADCSLTMPQSPDGFMTFTWKNRTTGAEDQPIILFPGLLLALLLLCCYCCFWMLLISLV